MITPPEVPLETLRDLYRAARWRSRLWTVLIGVLAATGMLLASWILLALAGAATAYLAFRVEPALDKAWALLDARTYQDGLRTGEHLHAISARRK